MKKILLILVMLFFTSSAFANNFFEVDAVIGCNDYKTVIGNLLIDFEEKMVFEGQSNSSFSSLFVNAQNGSWTIVKYDDNKTVACILADGIGYNIP